MTPDFNQPDLFGTGAREARDEGLKRVSDRAGPWMDLAKAHILSLRSGWIGTGEDWKLIFLAQGFPAPHHHNAWGAAIRDAAESGLLVRTGRMKHMKTRRSHARLNPEWRRL